VKSAANLQEIMAQVFFDMLAVGGRVFVAIRYDKDVVIGRRGFLPEEKEKGLVLVFNQKMKFDWDDAGISATLVFGTSPEKCFIPLGSIMTIFSPELNAQFSVLPAEKAPAADETDRDKEKGPSGGEKVIKVDFRGRKK
jgi:hypothetical protein